MLHVPVRAPGPLDVGEGWVFVDARLLHELMCMAAGGEPGRPAIMDE